MKHKLLRAEKKMKHKMLKIGKHHHGLKNSHHKEMIGEGANEHHLHENHHEEKLGHLKVVRSAMKRLKAHVIATHKNHKESKHFEKKVHEAYKHALKTHPGLHDFKHEVASQLHEHNHLKDAEIELGEVMEPEYLSYNN